MLKIRHGILEELDEVMSKQSEAGIKLWSLPYAGKLQRLRMGGDTSTLIHGKMVLTLLTRSCVPTTWINGERKMCGKLDLFMLRAKHGQYA